MNMPQPAQAPAPMGPPAPGPAPMETDQAENPVLDAMQTLMMYISAQTEMGSPQAPALQAAMEQLVTAFQAPQQQGPPAPGSAPAPAPAPQQPPEMSPQQAAQQPQQTAKAPARGRGQQAPSKPVPII